MEKEIEELIEASRKLEKPEPFTAKNKASDFLDLLFKNFAKSLKLPRLSLLQKKDFYELIDYMQPDDINLEVTTVLNHIHAIAERATPYSG